jgi:hypothetical protein
MNKTNEYVHEKESWTVEQSERLLTLWFSEVDGRFISIDRIQRMIKRKTRRAIETQLEKIAVHYHRNESELKLRQIDLGTIRDGEDWTARDLWVLYRATSRTSFKYGGHLAEVIGRKLGRSAASVRAKINSFSLKGKGFGLLEEIEPAKICNSFLTKTYRNYLDKQ